MGPGAADGAAGMIEVRLFDDLDAVGADAARALDRAGQPSLYDRLDWFRLNAAHGVGGGRPLVARARQSEAAAWLFLAGHGRKRGGILGGWYTLSFAPVFAGAADEACRARLLAAIAGALRARFGRILLSPLSETARAELARGFAAAGWAVAAEVASANWVAHVGGQDFATYWRRRPSRLRNTAKRKMRDAGLAIEIHDRFDAAGWAAYEAVYAASWKPEEGSPAFVRALAEAEGAAGTLRLAIGRRGGQAVAAQLWTVEGGVATIHKLAYAEAERARSPGTVLSEAMFRHVIDRDRPDLIDFGTGDDGYKADWMDEKRPLYRLTLYNRRSLDGWTGIVRARAAAWRRRGR
ncbi:GNAT family N-acetyltransferase [Sphingomonas profundi]|uniref:GNAT family N-acetyltransferase n=1 Tax=Alterirhizorhabdus profundi TaxID=2681549 RepID=UPI0012E908F1|nr:GNAT family N-acetyltransferase [Sphingomonas profundi]